MNSWRFSPALSRKLLKAVVLPVCAAAVSLPSGEKHGY